MINPKLILLIYGFVFIAIYGLKGKHYQYFRHQFTLKGRGVVGLGQGVMYLTSPGHTTEIGLQLGKACLLSLQQVRVEGDCFYFFCFFNFIHFPLSPLSLSFISSTISLLPFSEIPQLNQLPIKH